MASGRRLDYLKALGVDLWVRRDLPPEEAAALLAGPDPAGVASANSGSGEGVAPAEPTASAGLSGGASRQVAAPRAAEAVIPLPSSSRVRLRPDEPLSPEAEVEWDALKAEVLSCNKCALHSTRTQGVFGVGNRRAEWLVIGEAPGAEEDRRGEPFVGRAGQLLNAMLLSLGLKREQVFIANVLKSRPPGNRDPKPDEVAACLPFLMRQIALLQPRLMLAVGRIAAQNLLATDMALGRLRGQLHYFGELNTPLIVTYHPAYLLRSPADKRKAWEDLKFARSTFQRLASQDT